MACAPPLQLSKVPGLPLSTQNWLQEPTWRVKSLTCGELWAGCRKRCMWRQRWRDWAADTSSRASKRSEAVRCSPATLANSDSRVAAISM